jgi:regulatory protein
MADALSVAFAYLNRRERTVAEVRAKLEGAEFGDGEIELVITELLELNMLDDRRYARMFVEDKRTLEQWGIERISRTLSERGIDRELIAEALADEPSENELARAVELLGQRFPAPPQEWRDRERAFGVLVRKGYDTEIASDAVRAWTRGQD